MAHHPFKDQETYAAFQAAYESSMGASPEATAHIVANYEIMMDSLVKSLLIQTRVLPADNVGVHAQNRGGTCMSGQVFMAKGRKIVEVGTSTRLCGPERCVAMEDIPGINATYDRMERMAEGCPMFGRPSKKLIKYGSLGSSHLNQFIHAVCEGRPTLEEMLWTATGDKVIDHDRLWKNDSVLKDLCRTGLTWTIIPHEIGTMFPFLANMVQKALNTEHHIGEGESWSQVMQQLAVEAGRHVITKKGADHVTVDWVTVRKNVLASVPLVAPDVQCGLVIVKHEYRIYAC